MLGGMGEKPFDDLADVYDAMIDWTRRLAREEPFYRRVFARFEARRVIDVACGTGRHAARFHSWGLEVEAADLNASMIAHARARFGRPAGLRWVVRGFDQPIDAARPFDVALCVGNSLSLSPDADVVRRTLGQMLEALRPGGGLVLHVLNLAPLPDGPARWQKATRLMLPRGDVFLLKGVHRHGRRGYVDLVLSNVETGALLHGESVPFLGLDSTDLTCMVQEAGAAVIQCLGGYADEPFEPTKSTDLNMVARKEGESK